jgi:DNA-binding PadR family transcriptional regulator
MWDTFFGTGHCRDAGRRGGPFDAGFGAFWGGPGRGFGGQRGGRMFGQGDLKYVILSLLDEKPRHGYEIIKAIEERFAGAYSPSPGTVYPTLTMLEDLGYARAVPEEGGRRIYEITPEGKAYLAEHRETVDDIFERIAQFSAGLFGGPMNEVHVAFKDVARAAYSRAMRSTSDTERLKKIREVLERAAKELDAL